MGAETSLPEHIDLRSINAVTRYIPVIDSARSRVTAEMEFMVLSGLESLVSLSSRLHACCQSF